MKSKYEQVAAVIESRIADGEYATQSLLPGERAFAGELGVGRVTVRSGLKLLVDRGLLRALNGKGYEVLDPERSPRPRTMFIGGVFAGSRGPRSTGLTAAGASEVLEARGYHLVYSSSAGDLQQEMRKLRALLARGVDGLLLMPLYRRLPGGNTFDDQGNCPRVRQLHDSGIPLVVMDRTYAGGGLPGVGNDDVAGGRLATEYLLRRGHTRILYFAPTRDRIGKQRRRGYEQAMAAAGLSPAVHVLDHIPYAAMPRGNDPACVRETVEMLRGLDGVTGVVTMGAFARRIACLVADGQCSEPAFEWTGYDLPPDELHGFPSYPYMRRPLTEIGRRAAAKLLRLVAGDEDAATEEYLPPELVPAEGPAQPPPEPSIAIQATRPC